MPPLNDDFADAQLITGSSGSVNGDNTGATNEVPDPFVAAWGSGGGASVWYEWVAPSNGTVDFWTTGQGVGGDIGDTVLGVFHGPDYASLTADGYNDDAGSPGTHIDSPYSEVLAVAVTSATHYFVEVDGFSGDDVEPIDPSHAAQGTFELHWDFTAGAAPPPNTDCADAIPLVRLGCTGTLNIDNSGASDPDQDTDPLAYDFGASFGTLWYSFTNPLPVAAVLEVTLGNPSGVSRDPIVAILQGACPIVAPYDIVARLVPPGLSSFVGGSIPAGGTNPTPAALAIQPGETLYIEVGTGDSNKGEFSLHWALLDATFFNRIDPITIPDDYISEHVYETPPTNEILAPELYEIDGKFVVVTATGILQVDGTLLRAASYDLATDTWADEFDFFEFPPWEFDVACDGENVYVVWTTTTGVQTVICEADPPSRPVEVKAWQTDLFVYMRTPDGTWTSLIASPFGIEGLSENTQDLLVSHANPKICASPSEPGTCYVAWGERAFVYDCSVVGPVHAWSESTFVAGFGVNEAGPFAIYTFSQPAIPALTIDSQAAYTPYFSIRNDGDELQMFVIPPDVLHDRDIISFLNQIDVFKPLSSLSPMMTILPSDLAAVTGEAINYVADTTDSSFYGISALPAFNDLGGSSKRWLAVTWMEALDGSGALGTSMFELPADLSSGAAAIRGNPALSTTSGPAGAYSQTDTGPYQLGFYYDEAAQEPWLFYRAWNIGAVPPFHTSHLYRCPDDTWDYGLIWDGSYAGGDLQSPIQPSRFPVRIGDHFYFAGFLAALDARPMSGPWIVRAPIDKYICAVGDLAPCPEGVLAWNRVGNHRQ